MRERVNTLRRWVVRTWLSLPLLAIPGPCSTFDGAAPAEPADAADASAEESSALGPQPYLSLEDAVRVCSHVANCPTLPSSIALSIALPLASNAFAPCVHVLASPVPPSRPGFELHRGVLANIARARTCNEALAATPIELLIGDDPRCPATSESVCQDGHVVFCSPQGFGTFGQCSESRGGAKCLEVDVPDAGRAAVCATGACEGNVPEARCEGTTLHTCDPRQSKVATTFDCAWLGLRCGRGSEGYSTCVGDDDDDEQCPQFGTAICDGARARFCAGASTPWSTFRCDEIGGTCQGGMQADGGGPLPFCLHRDATCSPLDPDVGGCTGTTIDLCVDGEPISFDCATIGKQCDVRAHACL